jgi:hypothetical protein
MWEINTSPFFYVSILALTLREALWSCRGVIRRDSSFELSFQVRLCYSLRIRLYEFSSCIFYYVTQDPPAHRPLETYLDLVVVYLQES